VKTYFVTVRKGEEFNPAMRLSVVNSRGINLASKRASLSLDLLAYLLPESVRWAFKSRLDQRRRDIWQLACLAGETSTVAWLKLTTKLVVVGFSLGLSTFAVASNSWG
jgi:hypothetical protein